MTENEVKVDKNRELISRVIDLLNEGDLNPTEAKDLITLLSKSNERLIKQDKE